MRFDRFSQYEYQDTRRKRAAFVRKRVAEQERYPLFADMIASEQIHVDQEMAQRKEGWSSARKVGAGASLEIGRSVQKLGAKPGPYLHSIRTRLPWLHIGNAVVGLAIHPIFCQCCACMTMGA